ncbi:MAG TPA: rod-binding protein [Spirochaetota bacterium]|nr:rod-binding protein [Spirochaetota bacterium]OPZ39454.1 MAG: flagellar rod assembly protein/muramidase FlgJ [Spirochaetes bacterium ADurb.BinA120]HNU90478.1 rod-binding protein [Spirochaetota bacterium]HPO46445.1 rod-binding protein [Spirochaetota bacterium]HPV96528.1 rod-binding protein [Spirochaetota bacterium]
MIDAINMDLAVRPERGEQAGEISRRAEGAAKGFRDALEETVARENHKGARETKRPVDRRLMDACVEMESLFVAKMLKEMRKTVHKGEMLHGGFAEEIFEDMLYDEYALSLSKNSSIGIAGMLYDQLSLRA